MSKKNRYPYVDRKDKQVSVNLVDCVSASFSIENVFTRKKVAETGPMEKPAKGKAFDVKDPSVKLFYVLNIDGQDHLSIVEVGKLNASEGLHEAFDINDEGLAIKPNATVTIQSNSIEFGVNA